MAAALTASVGAGPPGQRWGCLVIDLASRFVVAHASGPREADLAVRVFAQTKRRSAGQVLPWGSGIRRPHTFWSPPIM